MSVKLGKFQMTEFKSWKGLTKDNHLGSIFRDQPQVLSDVYVQLLSARRGKSLDTYLQKFPIRYFEDDREYTWKVAQSSRRNIPLIEARDISGNVITVGNAGANFEPFYLVFPEDYFADGNILWGEKNELYPVRQLGDPKMEGSNAVIKVELHGGVSEGMPAEELSLGKRFSVGYSPVERELSRKVGDVRFSAPIDMRNEFSQIRIQHKVPGSMLGRKLACGIPVFRNGSSTPTVSNMWMHIVEWEVEDTFDIEKNNAIMFGRSNRSSNGEYFNVGKSGNLIKEGAGLREQLEYGNVSYYNEFSLKEIEDLLFELSAGVLGFEERRFVIETGERGAAQFSKAVQNIVAGSGWSMYATVNNPGTVHKVGSELHSNALSAGYQFVEYLAPNNIKVEIKVNPFYDDRERNKVEHPLGGLAESYRYDILYIGTTEQPNIQLAKIKDRGTLRSYFWGLRNPFTGKMGNDNMSTDEDSCAIHLMDWLGVMVIDPTRVASLIPSVLR